jgi:hypothetical protein
VYASSKSNRKEASQNKYIIHLVFILRNIRISENGSGICHFELEKKPGEMHQPVVFTGRPFEKKKERRLCLSIKKSYFTTPWL